MNASSIAVGTGRAALSGVGTDFSAAARFPRRLVTASSASLTGWTTGQRPGRTNGADALKLKPQSLICVGSSIEILSVSLVFMHYWTAS